MIRCGVVAPNGPLMPGQIVAQRYVVEALVGQGACGMVYAAKDQGLKRAVALKLIAPDRRLSMVAAARFEREVRICAQLTSDHAVRLLDAGTDPALGPYVVLELLDGQDLREIAASHGPIRIDHAALWLMQACDALSEAHALGIVHRDVKPANLFLAQQAGAQIIKVLDFGIALLAEDEQALTKTGGMPGTPRYMSPEQLAGKRDLDARSDVWSLGATLYELITGSPIFDADTSASFGALVLTATPVPLRARLPHAPAALEAVITTCLQFDRQRRYPTVIELARALAPFAGTEGLEPRTNGGAKPESGSAGFARFSHARRAARAAQRSDDGGTWTRRSGATNAVDPDDECSGADRAGEPIRSPQVGRRARRRCTAAPHVHRCGWSSRVSRAAEVRRWLDRRRRRGAARRERARFGVDERGADRARVRASERASGSIGATRGARALDQRSAHA